MPTLTGNVTSTTGDPGEKVRIFQWPDGPLSQTVTPDALGDWSAEIPYAGNYGITYIREGHDPITHGPYYVESALAQGEVDPNVPIPSTGLLAFWDMEGTTTSVVDSQGNYPLTLTHTDLRVADGFANDSGIEQPDSATYYGQLGSGNNLFGLTSDFELFYAIKPRVSPLSGQFRVLCLSSKTSGWDPDNYGLLFDVTSNLEVIYRVAQGKATGYNGGSRGHWSTGLFLKPGEYNLVFCSRDGVNAKAVVYNSDGVTSQTLAHNTGNLADWGTGVNAVLASSGGTTSPSYFSPPGAAIDYMGMYNRTLTEQERDDIWGRVGKASTVLWRTTDLFANGELGIDYDPSDLTTLFTDTAGTVSVTGDGDAVAYMADKSGNGFHATQPDAAKRPLYRTDGTLHWLEFDGVDDHLLITSGSLTGAFVTGFAVQYTDTSTQRILLGHSSSSSKYGVVSDTRDVFFRAVDGGVAVDVDVTNHVLTDSLWSGYRDTSDNVFARLKGQAVGSVAGQSGTAEFDVLGGTVYSTVIDLNFQGKFYGLTLAGGHSLDAAERLEGYMAHKLGLEADLPAAHPYKATPPTKEPVQTLAVPDSRYRVDDLTQLAATQVIRDQLGGRDFFTENLTTATVNSENTIYFNGTNARAYSVRMPFNNDFTINMWVSLPNPNDSDGCWLINNRTDNVGYAEQEFQLSVRTVADTATIWARNAAGTTFSAESSAIPANTKVLLSGVWEGDTLHIYLNGQLNQSVVFTGTRNISAACTVLGQRGWDFFDSPPPATGFGEFHLYGMDLYFNKALSASEIAAIYTAGV